MPRTTKTVTIEGRQYPLFASKYAKNLSVISVSDNMGGKLKNVIGISTSCTDNPFCMARHNNMPIKHDGEIECRCICEDCFACAQLGYKKGLRDNGILNSEILTSVIIPWDLLPEFFPTMTWIDENGNFHEEQTTLRFECFGELKNHIQAINYIHIAMKNYYCKCALWTKNNAFLYKAVDYVGFKPNNITFVRSSVYTNTFENKDCFKKVKRGRFDTDSKAWISDGVCFFWDYNFTVYSPEWLCHYRNNKTKADCIKDDFINCGGRSCRNCMRCYTSNCYLHSEMIIDHFGRRNTYYVNELLK